MCDKYIGIPEWKYNKESDWIKRNAGNEASSHLHVFISFIKLRKNKWKTNDLSKRRRKTMATVTKKILISKKETSTLPEIIGLIQTYRNLVLNGYLKANQRIFLSVMLWDVLFLVHLLPFGKKWSEIRFFLVIERRLALS